MSPAFQLFFIMQLFKFLFISMSLSLLPATEMSAQFIDVKETKSKPVKEAKSKPVKEKEIKPKVEREAKWKDFNRLYISYATEKVVYDNSISDDRKFQGINIGRMHSENITDGYYPLYLDYGLEATGVRYHDEEASEYKEAKGALEYNYEVKEMRKTKSDLISVAIPLNLTYLFATSSGKYGIAPVVGVNFKVNVYGRGKETFTKDYYYMDYKHNSQCVDETTKVNFFDKNDMADASVKRFQFGMNLGVNLYKGKMIIGYRFQPDFTKFRAGDFPAKTTTQLVSIGTRW